MKKKLVLIVILLLTMSMAIFGYVKLRTKNIQALEIDINACETEILNQYVVGDEVSIPETIKVDYYGEKTASNPYIECPNGLSLKSSTLKFNEPGIYKLKYSLTYNNLPVTFIQEITVKSEYFTISQDNGSYIKKSSDDDYLKSGKNGLIASLAENTILYYNKTINLNDTDSNGLSDVIEIDPRLGHYEDNIYTADQSKIYVVLTDAYDEKITVTLKMQRSENYNGAYFPGVKTYIQSCKGLDKGDLPNLGPSRQIILDGEKYRLWPDEEGSMNVGLFNYSTDMTTGACWKYEPSTKRFYFNYNNGANFLVTDLDEPIIYPDESLFPGFTTGEVNVSIYGLTYYSASNARIEIASIGGDDVYGLLDSKYIDDVAPTIEVDLDKNVIYKALDEEVIIPSARIIDTGYYKEAIVNVYRGYYSNNRINVSITNGTFTASKLDLYTIEYLAIDKAGNSSIKTIDVIVKETDNNQTINLSYNEVNLKCGVPVDLSYDVLSSLNSNVEDVDVKIHIKSLNQNLTLDSSTLFIPLYSGEYEIDYEYTDSISTYHSKYLVTCEKSNEISVIGKWNLPKHYLKSFNYSLDEVESYSYENGYPEYKKLDYYVVFDGGIEEKISDLSKVNITGNNTVKFIARLNDFEYQSDTFDIVDASYQNNQSKIDMTKLFIGDFTPSFTNDKGSRIADIVYVSNKDSGSNTLSFINSVLSETFRLTYRITEANSNFESLTIKLIDFSSDDIYSTITITKKEDGSYVSIDGSNESKLNDYDFYSNSKNTIQYNFSSSNLYIGSNVFKVKFNCPSSKCYIGITLNNIYGKSGIQVSQINNQVISGNSYNDNVGPEIEYKDFQGHYALGDIINISKFVSCDVLTGCNIKSISYYIVAPNNTNPVDENDNLLNNLDPNLTYKLKLTEIGNYYVIYKIEDFNGKLSTAQVCVSCIDTMPPTIKLDNMNDGATIIVEASRDIHIDFTISDDLSKQKDMKAFIHLYCIDQYSYVPNISKIDYKNMPEDGIFKETFIISVRGNYEAQIHVYDEYGNEAVKRIKIIVE